MVRDDGNVSLVRVTALSSLFSFFLFFGHESRLRMRRVEFDSDFLFFSFIAHGSLKEKVQKKEKKKQRKKHRGR
jgi:hypothetical protein